MLRLELTEQEQEGLILVLRSYLSELRNEVSHTDHRAYRQALKDQETSLRAILGKLTPQS